MDKVVPTVAADVADIGDGAEVSVGGFGPGVCRRRSSGPCTLVEQHAAGAGCRARTPVAAPGCARAPAAVRWRCSGPSRR